MYKITIQTLNGNEKTLYYPGSDEFAVMSADLSLKVGNAGEFKFTVPQSNPLYNEIVDRSIITIYEDNTEIWRGDIQDISQNFDKSLEVYALEDLAWLGDETVPMVAVENQTYAQRFSTVMANYNDNQPAKRQFQPGTITSVTTSNICHWQPLYEETLLECIRRCIADNGYLKVRRVTNNGTVTRYIDILLLEDYGQQAQQAIRFGSNLLDFVKEIDNTNFLNVLYPYGKETEEKLYGDIMRRIEGTPIQNDASIAAFGRHARTVIFETDSMANLNRLALAYLNRYSQPSLKIKAKAIDLGNIEDISRMHLGDSVRIIAEPFAIDQWDYITNQELDLLNIANNQIELSDAIRVSTLTSQVASQGEEIKDTRTPASVLDEAKRNAWSIIEGENGGIVTFDVNGNEQIVGIHIANNLDLDQATKAWGWNVNGLVYLHRTYPSDEWQVGIAMTMNGEIVADYITTGEMSADRINGGHIRANLITALNGTTAVGNNTLADFATKASTIIDVDVEYAKNQSSTTAPTSGWSTSSPQWEEGYYIWQRTKTTDGNNQASYSDPVCIQGADGQTGPAGVGVSAIVEQYYLSTSDQSPTGGSWSTSQPSWEEGKYIWTRSHVTWTDGTTTDTSPVLAQAINGANQAVQDLDDNLDQDEIFNRLIGDDTAQGIVLRNGKLYLRGDYLEAGAITVGGSAFSTNPTLVVKDTGNQDIVRLNVNEGIWAQEGTIGDLTLEDGELHGDGEYLLKDTKTYNEGNSSLGGGHSIITDLIPKDLRLSKPFKISVDYTVSDLSKTDTRNFRFELHQRSGNTNITVAQTSITEVEGSYTALLDYSISNTDTYNYAVYVMHDVGHTKFKLTTRVYIDDVSVVSLSRAGIYGTFTGTVFGVGNFDSLSADTITVDNLQITDNGIVRTSDDDAYKLDFTPTLIRSRNSSTQFTRFNNSDASLRIQDTANSYIDIMTGTPEINVYKSSSEYIRIKGNNPSIHIQDSSSEYLEVTAHKFRANTSSSQYVEISDYPKIEAYRDDYNFINISADDKKVQLSYDSTHYVIFQGGSNNDLLDRRGSNTYSIAWTSSDRRNKENIENLDTELSKNFIDATETKQFKYKDAEGKHYGMIAQDVRELLDNLGETDAHLEYCVNEEDEYDPRNINYSEYIPHIINYIKDLRSEIVSLKEEVRILKEERNDGKH